MKLILSVLQTSQTGLRIHIHEPEPKSPYRPEFASFAQISSSKGKACN